MSLDRKSVVAAFWTALDDALTEARSTMDELSSSLGKETKSTAGDKHETGRAMVQREMEQAGERLARCEVLQAMATRLDLDRARKEVGPGAIVVSGRARLLIGVGLGPFDVPGLGRFQAISTDAPIAGALAGAKEREVREFRDQPWTIESLT